MKQEMTTRRLVEAPSAYAVGRMSPLSIARKPEPLTYISRHSILISSVYPIRVVIFDELTFTVNTYVVSVYHVAVRFYEYGFHGLVSKAGLFP